MKYLGGEGESIEMRLGLPMNIQTMAGRGVENLGHPWLFVRHLIQQDQLLGLCQKMNF